MTSIDRNGGYLVIFEHKNGHFSGFTQSFSQYAQYHRLQMMEMYNDVVTWWIISILDNKVFESGGEKKDVHPSAFGYDPEIGLLSLNKDKG